MVAAADLGGFATVAVDGSACGFSDARGAAGISPPAAVARDSVMVVGAVVTDVSGPGVSGSERAGCASESDGVSGSVAVEVLSSEAASTVRLGD